MSEKHLTIGVDCGENTGIAVYDSKTRKLTHIHSTDFFGSFKFIKTFPRENTKIVVEVPPQFVYARNNHNKDSVRDKMLFNIGGNRREAELLAKGLKLCGFSVKEVLPVRAKKWTAAQLKRELGYSGRTNQHCRDAARLAFYHSGIKF